MKTTMSDYLNKGYYLYLGSYENDEENIKIGKTMDLYSRNCQYNTSHPLKDFIFKFATYKHACARTNPNSQVQSLRKCYMVALHVCMCVGTVATLNSPTIL